MNPFIKKQLLKCKNVKVNFSDDDTEIFIEKTNKVDASNLKVGSSYEFIVNEYESNPYLDDVNNYRKMNIGHYYGDLISIYKDIIKVNAVSIEDGNRFIGWLPINAVDIIQKI